MFFSINQLQNNFPTSGWFGRDDDLHTSIIMSLANMCYCRLAKQHYKNDFIPPQPIELAHFNLTSRIIPTCLIVDILLHFNNLANLQLIFLISHKRLSNLLIESGDAKSCQLYVTSRLKCINVFIFIINKTIYNNA